MGVTFDFKLTAKLVLSSRELPHGQLVNDLLFYMHPLPPHTHCTPPPPSHTSLPPSYLRLLKKAELQLGVLRQSVDQQLHRRCVNLERKVKEGGEAAEERRVRREEVKAEVEQLRKGLTQTVNRLCHFS